MTDKLEIHKADGAWVVRAGGAVIAESRDALEVTEGGTAPVVYFPREDVAMAFLDASDSRTACPRKGEAQYYTLHTKSGEIADAAWSYEAPLPGAERLAGYLAFYPDKVTVELL
ncbi:DUF427 domain-containing protein [Rhodovulum adriaticum]|uniref:Uncharacterized protein (DUF427 family) n=1 Tax=Rhodovulum adriaticum TaxID=35804 RepID=A0A4R2NXY0_RHOAD|nr:DUF427 domain-containing protein [Rhodovulum adriaticum]MBK1636284.1 hypothetical protein [Rhodovulum adriaticum]TCP26285.1 uncharacterized protein (DUF427 family) [Rhodovulum adriaticum]